MKSFLLVPRRFAVLLLAFGVITPPVLPAQIGPGKSLVFAQPTSRIELGAPALPPPWTLELWVKRQDSPGLSAPLFIDGTGALKLEQFQTGRRVGFTKFGVRDYSFAYSAPTNEWVHLALAANETETCLFVNGAFHSCVPDRIDLPLAYFGSAPAFPNDQLRAEVDELRVWQTELLEVRSRMHRRLTGTEPGLLGYWRCDEDSPAVALNSALARPTWTGLLTNLERAQSSVPFAPDLGETRFVPWNPGEPLLETMVHPGNLPTTLRILAGVNSILTNLADSAFVTAASNAAMPVRRRVPPPVGGRIVLAQIVASNAVGMTRSYTTPVRSPYFQMSGSGPWTNECHQPFAQPPVTAWMGPVRLAAGAHYSLAIGAEGQPAGWGWDADGQTRAPASASNLVAIAGGRSHTLAVRADGQLLAWGGNAQVESRIPAEAVDVIAVAAGEFNSLALRSGGGVVAWGDGRFGLTNVPANAVDVTAIAAGRFHNLALRANGTVVAWGQSTAGQIAVPSDVTNVVAIAAGGEHSLVITAGGRVRAWGNNSDGQATVPHHATNVVAVAAGLFHSLALRADGSVVAWGWNGYGQTNVPAAATNVIAIAAGFEHCLALRTDGQVLAWGRNDFGQCVVPTNALTHSLPVAVNPTIASSEVGPLPVAYITTNAYGVFSASRNIFVIDSRPPEITVLGSNPLRVWQGFPFVDPGITVQDACDYLLTLSTNGTIDTLRTGLQSVTYSAADSSGNSSSVTRTVLVEPAPVPIIVSQDTLSAAGTQALVRATVNPNGLPTSVYFRYGLTTNFGHVTVTTQIEAGVGPQPVEMLASGLEPCTTYLGQFMAENAAGLTPGPVLTFLSTPVPEVTRCTYGELSTNGTTLLAAIRPHGVPSAAWFEWGATTNYGHSTSPEFLAATANAVDLTARLSDLPSGLYHFRVVASNCAGVFAGYDRVVRVPRHLIVTSRADSGPGTLREAVAVSDDGDEIRFDIDGLIALTTGELTVTNDLSVTGPGADRLAISGSNTSRVFRVTEHGTLAISGLTVRDGRAPDGAAGGRNQGPEVGGGGGAIRSAGRLTLSDCALISNRGGRGGNGYTYGGGGGQGGALLNTGTAALQNCRLEQNVAGESGTASFGASGTGGHGGAIHNEGILSVVGCTFAHNAAGTSSSLIFSAGDAGNGGGISNQGELTVINCLFHGNAAGTGGDSRLDTGGAGGNGGGIHNAANGILRLIGSTIHGNTSGPGGESNYEHSTVRGGHGGGVANAGNLSILHCTITGNRTRPGGRGLVSPGPRGTGGGIYSASAPTFIANTIIARNELPEIPSDDGDDADLAGRFDLAQVLIGTYNNDAELNLNGPVILSPDPGLDDLADNGGPTLTQALLPESPAIDAGAASEDSPVSIDQRGFPRRAGHAVDVGAFEFQPAVTPLRIESISAAGPGAIRLEFTNSPGGTFTVWTTTNATAPAAQWSRVGTARPAPGAPGRFQLLDTNATNEVRRFYQLRSR